MPLALLVAGAAGGGRQDGVVPRQGCDPVRPHLDGGRGADLQGRLHRTPHRHRSVLTQVAGSVWPRYGPDLV